MTLASITLDIASLVELCAAVVIVLHAGKAIVALLQHRGIDTARLLLADGVLAALGFSLAATLLKVIVLQSWVQIRTFATVFLLRTILKQVFLHEKSGVAVRHGVSGTNSSFLPTIHITRTDH